MAVCFCLILALGAEPSFGLTDSRSMPSRVAILAAIRIALTCSSSVAPRSTVMLRSLLILSLALRISS
jgi:hypothetical protein